MTQWTSAEIDKIVVALAKAQSVMTAPVNDKTGQARGGKYQYASLASVRDALIPGLTAQEIAVVQSIGVMDDTNAVILRTSLVHASGQWLASEVPLYRLTATGGDPSAFYVAPQAMGSAITYARRYALLALCCQVGEDADDDGERASEEARKEAARKPQPPSKNVMRDTAATPLTSQSTAAGPPEVSQGLGGAPPRTRQVTEAILKTAAEKGMKALLDVYENVLTVPESKIFKAHIERVLMPIAQQVDADRRADEANIDEAEREDVT